MNSTSTRDIKSNARQSNDRHKINNENQIIVFLQDGIEATNQEVNSLKTDIFNIKKEYEIDQVEQKRDKKELEDTMTSNLKIIENLNIAIEHLSETIRDPISGLIVKLNETVKTTNESLILLRKIDEQYKGDILKINEKISDVDGRLKKVEETISSIKKVYWYVITAVLGIVIKNLWDLFTKGV